MKINIIAVGKIKKNWIKEGIEDYLERLKRFCTVNIIEIQDEKIPEKFSKKEVLNAVEKEGRKILDKMPPNCFSIALDLKGKNIGSIAFAELIRKNMNSGISCFSFIIGGSKGLSEKILKKCNKIISFGTNVFPHQLFRIMLLEQIYRAEKINAKETYHK